jgi:hypothetical protein
MAEKKRIRRINADDDEEEQPPQVTGSDLSSVGVNISCDVIYYLPNHYKKVLEKL